MSMNPIVHLLLILLVSMLEADSIQNTSSWYPKYHVVPSKGWMNDPNGLSYYNGYYHIFFQHDPDNVNPKLIHWGHARSKNLLSFEYLPLAISPSLNEDSYGIFSGSAVVRDGRIHLIYTGVSENFTRQRQMVAVGDEDGVNFQKLGMVISREGHEVNFRDPKAWSQGDSWFVVIGSQTDDKKGQVLLFSSKDFLHWTYEGPLAQADEKMGFMWECPDFFTLNDKQILVINPQGLVPEGYDYQNLYQTGYYVGNWSPGSNYTIEQGFREIDHGHDFYATQTFLAPDGRRIMIGWMDMWEAEFPEKSFGWAGMLTLPRELTLDDSGHLRSSPIKEIREVRVEKLKSHIPLVINNGSSTLLASKIQSSEVRLEIETAGSSCRKIGIGFGEDSISDEGIKIYVDLPLNRIFLERNYPQYNITASTRSVAVSLNVTPLILDIFIDGSSIELFINDGEAVMSSRIYPNNDQRNVYLFANDGSFTVQNYSVWDI